MRTGRLVALAVLALAVIAPPASAEPAEPADDRLPAATVAAREHFFGPANVDAAGNVRADRVIASWFSVGSVALAIDGGVVLLDTYIHKGEDRPNYVPTTTDELVALRPEAIFIGHGHFDHAATAGVIAARTAAVLVGTPEHCDQAREEAGRDIACLHAVDRASAPGAEVRELRPLGEDVEVSVLKHVHGAAEPPDGEHHESTLHTAPVPDPGLILLHPPGPSVIQGLNPAGDEGGTLLYQFRVGSFSLVWHDSAGPLRERAPNLLGVLRELPPTDVQIGAVLGFNDPTNGLRDPVDYLAAIGPDLFFPIHHDFVAEYGMSKYMEGVMRREMARREGIESEVRWLYDPYDYLRPTLMTFDVDDARWADTPLETARAAGLRLSRRCTGGGRLSARLLGDARAVRDASFKLDRRLVRNDARAPFTQTIGRRTLERTGARRLRAVVYLAGPGNQRVVLSRPLSRCGVR